MEMNILKWIIIPNLFKFTFEAYNNAINVNLLQFFEFINKPVLLIIFSIYNNAIIGI